MSYETRLRELRSRVRTHSEESRAIQSEIKQLVAEVAADKGITMKPQSTKATKGSLEQQLALLAKHAGKAQNEIDGMLMGCNGVSQTLRVDAGRPHDAAPDKLYFGFWRNADNPHLPMPVSNAQMTQQMTEVASALLYLQVEGHAHETRYRGLSPCRLCKDLLGNAEYEIDGYVWPGGLVHYFQIHNIDVPERLQESLVATFTRLHKDRT